MTAQLGIKESMFVPTNNPRKLEAHGNARNNLQQPFHRNGKSLNMAQTKSYIQHKRYSHKHIHQPSREQFQPGYSSEPEFIEYSLDRSWISQQNINSENIINQTLPSDFDFESKMESEMLNVRLPKLIYYDGEDHYQRSDFKKLSKSDN